MITLMSAELPNGQNTSDSMELRLTRLTTQHSGMYSCALPGLGGDLSLLTLHKFNLVVQSRTLCVQFAPIQTHTRSRISIEKA